ncbi:MAG: hypothetical protein JNM18_26010 [Planctomycetaceae bacterium]|nr:hypothetical protein [Planctomycetaceae bacterium]
MAKKKSSTPVAAAKTAPAKKSGGKKPAKASKKKSAVDALHDPNCVIDHDHEHDEPDTFMAVYEASPGLVVLFDAVISSTGGSDKVTLGDIAKILDGMNKTMKRLGSISPKTTLQKIEYLEKLPK